MSGIKRLISDKNFEKTVKILLCTHSRPILPNFQENKIFLKKIKHRHCCTFTDIPSHVNIIKKLIMSQFYEISVAGRQKYQQVKETDR